jgi:tetratricopeptide (TPR) repeat protein
LPVGQTIDYSFDALNLSAGAATAWGLVDLCILLAGVGLVLWGLARRSWVGLAGAWMILFYLPHLGIIPWHEIFAERFLYLPAVGFCFALAAAGVALAGLPAWRRPALAAGVVALALLGLSTRQRNEVWADDMALWKSAVERYPNTARAHKGLADAYMQETRPDLAAQHYDRAVAILPVYTDAWVGKAVALTAQMRVREAMEAVDALLERQPAEPKALNLKGYLHQTLGETDQAFAAYQRAVDVQPGFAEGYNNLARLYVERGEIEKAVEMYHAALERDPSLVASWMNLAVIYREAYRDTAKAEAYEHQARRLTNARESAVPR